MHMHERLRVALVHARLNYARGKSYLDVTAGLLGGFVASGRLDLAGYSMAILVVIYTAVGHLDRRYLRLWQEESRQGAELNPDFVRLCKNVEECAEILRRDARARV